MWRKEQTMKYQKEIEDALLSLGIIVDKDFCELALEDVIEGSLTFISFVVEIEEKMSIEVPDEYLQKGVLKTFADVDEMVGVIKLQNAI